MKMRAGFALAIALIGWLVTSSLRGEPEAPPAQTRPALDQGSRLTLHLHNVDLSTAIKAVAEASGNDALRPQQRNAYPNALINIDCDNEPFWSVMRQLCVEGRGYVEGYNGSLTVWPSGVLPNGPMLTDGPVMFVVGDVQHNIDFTKSLDWCAVQLEIAWEPRLNPVGYWPVIIPDEAADENGVSLKPTAQTPLNNGEIAGGGRWADGAREIRLSGDYRLQPCSVWVRLAPPDNAGHRINRLKGNLALLVEKEGQSKEIGTVADLNAAGTDGKKVGFDNGLNLMVTIRQELVPVMVRPGVTRPSVTRPSVGQPGMVRPGVTRPGALVLNLQIVHDERDEQGQSRQAQLEALRAWTVDDTGKTTACQMFGPRRIGVAEYLLPGGAVKVVLEAVGEEELKLPFEFRDLPLP